MRCFYCSKETDLRPYGPRGSMVCFQCAMQSPVRRAETERNFATQLNACGSFAVAGGATGPYPLAHAEPELRAIIGRLDASVITQYEKEKAK